GREILKILQVFLRFPSVVAVESDPHLGAIPGSYSFVRPNRRRSCDRHCTFALIRESVLAHPGLEAHLCCGGDLSPSVIRKLAPRANKPISAARCSSMRVIRRTHPCGWAQRAFEHRSPSS